MAKACSTDVRGSHIPSILSLGMMMRVSTQGSILAMPSSAFFMRWRPSKPNGLVQTAMVNAPAALAAWATIGAAPVPVPPPMPHVTNTMPVSPTISFISSRLSSADLMPLVGSPPAPRPRVRRLPICRRSDGSDRARACASVFIVMNSTPRTSFLTMRVTALQPPPPTPMTLILAGLEANPAFAIAFLLFLSSIFNFIIYSLTTEHVLEAHHEALHYSGYRRTLSPCLRAFMPHCPEQ